MAKLGRNDRCPCGSGKKYKACCLTRDEAAKREQLTKAQAARDERAADKRQSLREVRETMLARLAGGEAAYDDDDALMDASRQEAGRRSTDLDRVREQEPSRKRSRQAVAMIS